MKRVLVGACVFLALGVTGPGAHGGSDAFPADAFRLVVLSESSFGPQFVLLETSGRQAAALGGPFGIRSAGSVSPDGTSIAAASTVAFSEEEPDSELVLANLHGSGQFLTENGSNEGRPSWSPDGRGIAYASDRDGDWDIYLAAVTDADSPVLNLTAGSPADDRNPRWSPDGTRIAFESDRSGDVDLYVAAIDGSAVTAVAPSSATERLGDWAPDSSRLVFSSDRASGLDLYVVAASVGAPTRLTSARGDETSAAWSPDGSTIAFSSNRDGDTDVFTVRADGADERRLTNDASEDLVQDWQPLRDTRPPVVTALPSTGVRGRTIRLRFRIDEDSRIAAVSYSITFARGRGSGDRSAARYAPGRVYTLDIPASFGPRAWPASVRFCVEAMDPSANTSAPSCARFRFVRRR